MLRRTLYENFAVYVLLLHVAGAATTNDDINVFYTFVNASEEPII